MKLRCKHGERVLFFKRGTKTIVLHRKDGKHCNAEVVISGVRVNLSSAFNSHSKNYKDCTHTVDLTRIPSGFLVMLTCSSTNHECVTPYKGNDLAQAIRTYISHCLSI